MLLLCTKEYFNKDLLGLLLTREDLDTHPKCKLNNEAGQQLTPYLCARYFDNKEAEEILQQDRRFNCEKGIPKYPLSSTKMKGLLYKFLQKVCRL